MSKNLFGEEELDEELVSVPEDDVENGKPESEGNSNQILDLNDIPLKVTDNTFALYRSILAESGFALSATAQKMLHYAFSVLDENKMADVEIEDNVFGKMKYPGVRFFISDFNRALSQEGGQQRTAAKTAVDELRRFSFKHKYSDGREVSMNMFQVSDYDPNNNSVGLIFSEPARNMLTEFPKFFKIPFRDLIGITSPYTVKLLDFLEMKRYLAGQSGNKRKEYWVRLTIPQIRTLLAIPDDKYVDNANFKRRVIEKAINEINDKAKTIKIKNYTYETEHRVCTAIKMYIIENDDFEFDSIQTVISFLGKGISKENKKLIIDNKEEYLSILKEMNQIKKLDFSKINDQTLFEQFFDLFLSAAQSLVKSLRTDENLVDYVGMFGRGNNDGR